MKKIIVLLAAVMSFVLLGCSDNHKKIKGPNEEAHRLYKIRSICYDGYMFLYVKDEGSWSASQSQFFITDEHGNTVPRRGKAKQKQAEHNRSEE